MAGDIGCCRAGDQVMRTKSEIFLAELHQIDHAKAL
jgi:hypothetical protein